YDDPPTPPRPRLWHMPYSCAVAPLRPAPQWHESVPVSVWPTTGTNSQEYEPFANLSLSTPNAPLMFTSLFGMVSVFGASRPSPPVPTMISRMPFAGSASPVGVRGAKRP